MRFSGRARQILVVAALIVVFPVTIWFCLKKFVFIVRYLDPVTVIVERPLEAKTDREIVEVTARKAAGIAGFRVESWTVLDAQPPPSNEPWKPWIVILGAPDNIGTVEADVWLGDPEVKVEVAAVK